MHIDTRIVGKIGPTAQRARSAASVEVPQKERALPQESFQGSATAMASPASPALAPEDAIQATLSPELALVTQQTTGQLLSSVGKSTFQSMVADAQQSPSLMPIFKEMGSAAHSLAGGSEPDLYYHLSQSLHHLDVAKDAALQRGQLGSELSFGELLSQEMKTQAQGLALLPHIPPSLMAEAQERAESFKTTAASSQSEQSLQFLKSRLPSEVMEGALASLAQQPLHQAAETAKHLPAQSETTIGALADRARGFLPLALGARGLFFQSAQGVGQHPAAELSRMGELMSREFFSEEGELSRLSPGFAKFSQAFVGPEPSQEKGFRGATDLGVLLLAMETGEERARIFGGSRAQGMSSALDQLLLQQGLMSVAGPILQQGASNAVEQQMAPRPLEPPKRKLLASEPVGEIGSYNQHLLGMLSEEQTERVSALVENHPLKQLQQASDLAKLKDSFELAPAGEKRLRKSLAQFTGNLIALQQGVMQALDAAPIAD